MYKMRPGNSARDRIIFTGWFAYDPAGGRPWIRITDDEARTIRQRIRIEKLDVELKKV